MKKKSSVLLGVLVALVFAFALSACGKVALKLTFKVDGVDYATISTSGDEVIKMPEKPTKDGYEFDGWFWDEGTWQKPFTANSLLDTPLSSDMSVYAKFSVDATPTGTEIKAEGFEKNDSVYYTKVSNTTETFSFIGKIRVADGAIWRVFTNVACTAEVPSRTKEISVGDNKFYILVTNGNDVNSYSFVVRRRPIHTVTYRTNNGSYITSQRVEEDSYATAFTPTLAGYTFKTWNYDFTQPIVGDTTITASFNVITYNIEYDLVGGEFEGEYVKTYTVETSTFSLASPVKRGYTFLGWYDGDKKVEKITRNSIGDRNFTAKWGATPYSISYNLGGGTNAANNPTTYTVEQTITLSDASRGGYRFVGWKEGNVIEKGNVGAKTFTAQWEAVTYSIFYNLDGGEFGGEYHQSYDIETDTFSLVAPVKRGYTFLGWYDGETKVVQIEKGNFGEKRFTAKWEVVAYSINYTIDYGENNENNELTYTVNDEVEFFDPYYINGDFVKWQDINGNKITKIEKGSIGDVSITAVYDLYDVKLRLNNDDTFTVVGKQTKGNTVNIKSEYKGKKVTSIGSSAFSGCSGLTSITIPDSVTNIGYEAFYNCSGLTSVTIPNSITSIGNSAFCSCSSIMSVTIPNSVTSIGDSVFSGCSSLKYNEYDNAKYLGNDTNPYLLLVKAKSTDVTTCNINERTRFIHSSAFEGCSSLTNISLFDNVTSIEGSTFKNCSSLTSITIPESVKSIGNSVFYGCSGLTNITIPDSITSIGSWAFKGCSSLNYNKYDNAKYLGNTNNPYLALIECAYTFITSCKINDQTKVIAALAFDDCTSLTSVTIPYSVSNIGHGVFSDCRSLKSINVDKNNSTYKSIDDNLYTIDGNILIRYAAGKTETKFSIPDSVTIIGEYAFRECGSLTSITIPNSVTSIGFSAFSKCKSLTSIVIPNSVTSIDWYTFADCSSLTSVTIGNSVTDIGVSAFSGCRSLTSVTIPYSVSNIEHGVFSDCRSLKSINVDKNNSTYKSIDDNLYTIDGNILIRYAAGKTETKFSIPDSVTIIGEYAFGECGSLTSITIPNSATSIGFSAFSNCSSLTKVYYKGTAEEWNSIDVKSYGNNSLTYATKYYYSETEPTDDGNYWRYVDGVPTVWTKEN